MDTSLTQMTACPGALLLESVSAFAFSLFLFLFGLPHFLAICPVSGKQTRAHASIVTRWQGVIGSEVSLSRRSLKVDPELAATRKWARK